MGKGQGSLADVLLWRGGQRHWAKAYRTVRETGKGIEEESEFC